jgi:hypothetical protein
MFADGVYVSQIGCVAEYDPSGINEGDATWYDSSDNDLDGTITGAKYINVPTGTDDYYLAEFGSEVNAQYWFFQFNADGLTGVAGVDTLVGQVAFGKAYSYDVGETSDFPGLDTYSGDAAFPGVDVQETDAGNFLTQKRFGRRERFDIEFTPMTETQFLNLQEMAEALDGPKLPFWVSFNWGETDTIVHRVRLDDDVSWSYNYIASERRWPSLRLSMVSDD